MTAPGPRPTPRPPVGAPPPEPAEARYLPHLDLVAPDAAGLAYDRAAPDVVRLFAVQAGWTVAKLGVRRGDRHLEVRLDPAALRALAADALAKADLLDGAPPELQAIVDRLAP